MALMRRYSRTAWRWVDAYERGLDGVLARWAVRKSKSHRTITDAVDREVNRLSEERKASARARAEGPVEPPVVPGVLADLEAAGVLGDEDDDGPFFRISWPNKPDFLRTPPKISRYLREPGLVSSPL